MDSGLRLLAQAKINGISEKMPSGFFPRIGLMQILLSPTLQRRNQTEKKMKINYQVCIKTVKTAQIVLVKYAVKWTF